MKVMVFGTFDVLHKGHIFFLQQAKRMGKKLVVVVSRDETVNKLKGKKPIYNYKQRIGFINKINIADKIIAGDLIDIFKCIREEKPDIIALGYDQKYFIDKLNNYIKEKKLKIRILKLKPYYPKKYKSSIIKKKIKKYE